jgi:hypothetical protein
MVLPGRRLVDAPAADQVLERSLFNELYGMMGPRELANKPRVQQVLRDIRLRLVRQGYLRPWRRRVLPPAGPAPRRTRAEKDALGVTPWPTGFSWRTPGTW